MIQLNPNVSKCQQSYGNKPGEGKTLTVDNLTSNDPPVLSRLAPGQAEAGKGVILHGVNFGDGSDGLQTTVIQYEYDPLYRLTGAGYSGTITATYAYTYDPVGNMTAYTETVGLTTTVVHRTFDAANQLVTASDTELGTTSFYYDGNGVTTTHHLFGLDLIHVDDGSETRTVLGDGLGNGRVEMVGSAVETATTYEPYGKVLAQSAATSSSPGTVYGFTGEQYDALTGQVYLRARYYNPYLNQFQSRDPFPGYAKLPQSQNGYNYANSNPANFIDPSGLCISEGDGGDCQHDPLQNSSNTLIDFQGVSGQHWSSSEKREVNRAAWQIARRFADTYNEYMYGFRVSSFLVDNEYFLFNCGPNGRPLTPREAFLYAYGGEVLFYKTGTQNGTAYGKYEYIAVVNRSGIKVYTAANITSSTAGYRWATHEMGHFFEARVNDILGVYHVRNTLGADSDIMRRGTDNDVRSYGFAGVRYGWQQSPEDTTGEEFADMFGMCQ